MSGTFLRAIPQELTGRIQFADSGCWIWRGSVNGNNYPYDYVNGKFEYIPIYLYERLVSELPKRTRLWRRCENTLCVCPEHMMPGKAVSGRPEAPYTLTFDTSERLYKAVHERRPDCEGWGETPDEALLDCDSEVRWLESHL